jgi:hypothetical protein
VVPSALQRLRQGLVSCQDEPGEADEGITHLFPMPQRAARG